MFALARMLGDFNSFKCENITLYRMSNTISDNVRKVRAFDSFVPVLRGFTFALAPKIFWTFITNI